MTQSIKRLVSFSLLLSPLLLTLCSPISSVSPNEAVSSTSSAESLRSINYFQQRKDLATNIASKFSFFANRKIQVQIKRRGRFVRPPVVTGSKTKSSSAIREQVSVPYLNALLIVSISCMFVLI